ncbi:MAG TPA: hypothetical protein VG206_17825 [Terriglobia bacterium]|nr:hypothetical protein [Terriglobia bacterium]
MKPDESATPSPDKFSDFMRRLLAVPHKEVQQKMDAYNVQKRRRKAARKRAKA